MIGQTIAHYRVTAKLGAGGMGEVYRATDTRLGRDVALKVLPENVVSDPVARERLLNEARTASALNHPHICTIHEVGEADGQIFIAMEYVEGRPVSALIGSEGLPAESVIRYGIQMADALEHAHQRGVVHRDLKPSNVIITPEGRAKILDFGLARHLEKELTEATRSRLSLAEAGTVVGTLQYMAPEVLQGKAADARSDVWSLGVTLYEMAAGALPFRGDTGFEMTSAILRDALRPLPASVPVGLGAVIQHCLEKNPGERYQRAGEVRAALETLQSGVHVPTAPLPASRISRRWFLGVGAAVALVVLLALAWGWRDRLFGPAVPRIESLAVLPLDNYSGDPAQDYFAEGMTDELTADLATISQLRVISRGSATQFKGANRPPTPEIAKVLNVDALVEGSVIRIGDRVRITAELIDARQDKQLWAKSFERSSRDVLALQNELAAAIAREIHVQLTPTEESRLTSAPVVSPEAHDAYLRGRYFFNRPSDVNLKKAIAEFQEAVRLDPKFAPAYSGLSDAYLWAGFNEGVLTAAEAKTKAKEAAQKAIELDENSAEAHASLATYKLFYEHDWTGSEREYRRAFLLNPNYAFAHDQFGLGLAFQGRFEESQAEGQRAASLDPLSPQIPIDRVFAYAWQGNFQAAKEQVKRAADLDPTFFFVPQTYGWIDLQAGKAAAAIPEFQKAAAMESPSFVVAFLGYAYGASGDRARAMAQMEALKSKPLHGHVPPFNLAIVYLGMGDHARALDYLEQAYAADSQWMCWLKQDRIFDPLRSDPRFQDLLRRLNFSQD